MIIPPWLTIGLATVAIGVGFTRLFPSDLKWFNRQKRPKWLTFEGLIPLIWITIFICGAWSAYAVWESTPGQNSRWLFMAGYACLEMLVLAYTPVMTKMRSLTVGAIVGLVGWIWGLGLAIAVAQSSWVALGLLIPFLLWSPVGTIVTWEMAKINRL
jgi:tryptophan-rich sensory protein